MTSNATAPPIGFEAPPAYTQNEHYQGYGPNTGGYPPPSGPGYATQGPVNYPGPGYPTQQGYPPASGPGYAGYPQQEGWAQQGPQQYQHQPYNQNYGYPQAQYIHSQQPHYGQDRVVYVENERKHEDKSAECCLIGCLSAMCLCCLCNELD